MVFSVSITHTPTPTPNTNSFNTNSSLYTVSRDGSFFIWNWPSPSDPLSLKQKHYLQLDHSTIRSCAFTDNLLGIGFDSGVFSLYALDGDDVNRIHHLSVSSNMIDTITLNQDGTWLALGSSTLGQILVWEWVRHQLLSHVSRFK